MEGIKQQKLPQALWNLDRIDKRGTALNGIYRCLMQPPRCFPSGTRDACRLLTCRPEPYDHVGLGLVLVKTLAEATLPGTLCAALDHLKLKRVRHGYAPWRILILPPAC